MKSIARFITRPSNIPGSTPDLLIGGFYRNNDVIPAGRVFEIREVLGVLTIVDLGPSALGVDLQENSVRGDICWSNSVSHLLEVGGTTLLLTKQEYRTYTASNPKGSDDGRVPSPHQYRE